MLNRLFKIISNIRILFLFILMIFIAIHFASRAFPSVNIKGDIDLLKDLIVIFSGMIVSLTMFETFIIEFVFYRDWKNKLLQTKEAILLFVTLSLKILFIILFSIILYLINKPMGININTNYYNDIKLIIFFFICSLISFIFSNTITWLKQFTNILKLEVNKNEI